MTNNANNPRKLKEKLLRSLKGINSKQPDAEVFRIFYCLFYLQEVTKTKAREGTSLYNTYKI